MNAKAVYQVTSFLLSFFFFFIFFKVIGHFINKKHKRHSQVEHMTYTRFGRVILNCDNTFPVGGINSETSFLGLMPIMCIPNPHK